MWLAGLRLESYPWLARPSFRKCLPGRAELQYLVAGGGNVLVVRGCSGLETRECYVRRLWYVAYCLVIGEVGQRTVRSEAYGYGGVAFL